MFNSSILRKHYYLNVSPFPFNYKATRYITRSSARESLYTRALVQISSNNRRRRRIPRRNFPPACTAPLYRATETNKQRKKTREQNLNRKALKERKKEREYERKKKPRLSWCWLVCCRHEVPVTSEPITVIHMDEDVVVVNKPASIPVSGVLPGLYCQISHASHTHTHTHARIHTRTYIVSLRSRELSVKSMYASVLHSRLSRCCVFASVRSELQLKFVVVSFRSV